MSAWILFRNKGAGGDTKLGEGWGTASAGEESTQNSGRVPVERGCGDIKCDAGNRSCGVVADSWKLKEFLGIGRKSALGKSKNRLGEGVKKAGTTVVTESLPVTENDGLGGSGKGRPVRKTVQPSMVVGKNGGDSSLLAHKFGNGDVVGGGGSAPGKGALVVFEPAIKKGHSPSDFRIDERAGGPRVQRHG